MIPKSAFIALTTLMMSAWAFGVACDRLFSAWVQGHGSEDDTDDDTEADHDRWEDDPEPTNLRR